jgi:DNA-directed RNA polymerase specialized sigma24 family protein
MCIQILVALDQERHVLAGDPAAHRRFEQWKQEEPVLAAVKDVAGLLAVANNRGDLEAGDAVLAVLARRAPSDPLAAQILLHALMPGLKQLIRSCHAGSGGDDLASEVLTVALERIRCYPFDRCPRRIAANILRDVRQHIWRKLARQRRMADRLGKAVSFEDERVGRGDEKSSSDQLVDLVADAVRRGRVSLRGGRLILMYRVLGVPTAVLADAEGRSFSAVERSRQRAEADLAAAVA